MVQLDTERAPRTAHMLREETRGAAISFAQQTERKNIGNKILVQGDTEWVRRNREDFETINY